MEKIRICIGSSDGQQVSNSHMGDTDIFLVYDLKEKDSADFVEKRVNSAKAMDHDAADKMAAVMALLSDVDVFVARRNSPNFKKIAGKTGHQPVVVVAETVPEVLILLQHAWPALSGYVARRKNGEAFELIPEL